MNYNPYYYKIEREVSKWIAEISEPENNIKQKAQGIQDKLNSIYPEKYHQIMTEAVKGMVKAVILGIDYIPNPPIIRTSLQRRDKMAYREISYHKRMAMIEGAYTGMGGIVLGLMDFPLLLSIKMKMLYELSAIYGYDTFSVRERVYMLLIFHLAFSPQKSKKVILSRLENWDEYKKTIPEDMSNLDWQNFQREYRDYIDFAKLLQILPIVGAPIGAYVNNKLLGSLGTTAINSFHLRYMKYF
ncbi:hypothetical protein AN640_02880 [Candidatus Epulonipiscium fishelsonii]|uniref:Uncharacterized protein n=1 Tax=Candidatus Epulonipiscium fishelsonii TaxID=77094 RepID=A0ACC8X7X1_9FIRM|nr:hypothetical protein AN640_02880 [Epulopiscium sp. SCG-D08WGA-EpuloA1]OON90525.1 MAG: hypothetical protein ATN32_03700 [Epulopiscium sp. AS2M-Bin002]